MRRLIGLFVIALAVSIFAASSLASRSTTKSTTYKAVLGAAQVVPHPKGTRAGAAGTFTATVTGTTLKWKLTFTHLTGTAVAAHVHLGARGKNGIALIALCGPCKSPLTGTANSVTDDVAALMAKGGAYVNVHTNKNAEGEIRGEITGH